MFLWVKKILCGEGIRERALAGTMPCQPGSQPKGWLGIWANASMRGQKWMGRKVSLSAATFVPYPTREETNGMVSHCEEAPDQCSVIEKAVQIVTPIEVHTPATCTQAPISILRFPPSPHRQSSKGPRLPLHSIAHPSDYFPLRNANSGAQVKLSMMLT